MNVRWVLRLSVWLGSLSLAHQRARPPQVKPPSEGPGLIPVAELRVLSLGLVNLLQGLGESRMRAGSKGTQLEERLEGGVRATDTLRERALQAGRTHRQARKDLQVMAAQGDGLERAAQEVQQGLGALVAERGALEVRMGRVLEKVQSLTQPPSEETGTAVDTTLLKAIMDTQSSRLANLVSEVVARDRLITLHLQHIDNLEKQVSQIRGERPPSSAGGRF